MIKKFTSKNLDFTWNYDLKEIIKDNFDNKRLSQEVQKVVKNNILESIKVGLSPVDGAKNFEKYKNPASYPGDLKSSNKPNLKLTGKMLSYYEARETGKDMEVSVGIHKDAPEEERTKAEAHNFGTQGSRGRNLQSAKAKAGRGELGAVRRKAASKLIQGTKGIPVRPFIPKPNQMFNKTITLAIRKAFAYCLGLAIKKGK